MKKLLSISKSKPLNYVKKFNWEKVADIFESKLQKIKTNEEEILHT